MPLSLKQSNYGQLLKHLKERNISNSFVRKLNDKDEEEIRKKVVSALQKGKKIKENKVAQIMQLVFCILKKDTNRELITLMEENKVTLSTLNCIPKKSTIVKQFSTILEVFYTIKRDYNNVDSNVFDTINTNSEILSYFTSIVKCWKMISKVAFNNKKYTNEELGVLQILYYEQCRFYCKTSDCIIKLTPLVPTFDILETQTLKQNVSMVDDLKYELLNANKDEIVRERYGTLPPQSYYQLSPLTSFLKQRAEKKMMGIECKMTEDEIVNYAHQTSSNFLQNNNKINLFISRKYQPIYYLQQLALLHKNNAKDSSAIVDELF
ncbi:hypothetical protein EIN_065020 [Entamoeba invadens IP1]|uniref:Uncharacterized protein n=1 Tax=Entamoeba invadens IP1 TaxID=370355 RepID=A0A0A1TV91_ENTIV|nr:hypothetical protein EIN_065020 [Entamoeba invadens IP1]ELP84257.1 hypothetical protein EIN_065020 [Entamoeba invadens IP1]|eukprot:XP_004183603.1 hypothetical protein EIN_065020 [Entamoeba invadens IP1]